MKNRKPRLSHVDGRGRIRMVDVGGKAETAREAVARGRITVGRAALSAIREVLGAPRGEAIAERSREHRRGHALVDRGLERPASFARIGDSAGKWLQARFLEQRRSEEIE